MIWMDEKSTERLKTEYTENVISTLNVTRATVDSHALTNAVLCKLFGSHDEDAVTAFPQ